MANETMERLIAAIISTGDELLQGRTIDTNAAHIADRLYAIGLEAHSVITVGDYPERIAWAWEQSLAQADVVISTGGLGPTADDLTNETLARVAGVPLAFNAPEAQRIREYFARAGRSMPENNLKQAMLPEGAVVIRNRLGTAPGCRLVITRGARRSTAIVLPGVPREMKVMLEEEVIPWLLGQVGEETCFRSCTFQTFGMSESALDEALVGAIAPAEGRLSFRASFPQVSVRVSVTDTPAQAERRLEALAEIIRSRLGPAVIAEGETKMEEVVGELLRRHGRTLGVAESCSGGLIGDRITDVPGSSAYFVGGVIAYSNDLKERLLGVQRATLEEFGAVSVETAREMALGIRHATGAALGLATTGIAGPEGGTTEKPVGTVAIALAADELDDGVAARLYKLWGNREWIKILTSQVALDWVRRHLLGLDPLSSEFGLRGRTPLAGRAAFR